MFKGKNMSRSARQAAKGKGLSKVGSYEILDNQSNVVDLLDPNSQEVADNVVIRAHSPGGQKSVDITAGDLYFYETEYQDAPMANV